MPKSANQKQRILLLMQYLLNKTDENHPVTLAQMGDYLDSCGAPGERKTLYDDIETLRAFGLDIILIRGRNGGYYVGQREFQLPELRLLVDAVQSSRFITGKKSRELIGKLERLTSQSQAKLLHRQVFVKNRIKTMNESIYYIVDELQSAITSDRAIAFSYFDYDLRKRRVYRHNNKRYLISPYALVWDNENYYLIGFDAERQSSIHFRVDKMDRIELLDQARDGHAVMDDLDLSEYMDSHFDMFRGQKQRVRLRVENRLAGAVIDRFGKDVSLIPDGKEHFTVTVDVTVSPRFFGWVCGFDQSMKIVGPEAVVNDMRDFVRTISTQYEEDAHETV